MFYSRKLVLTGLCSTVLAAAFAGKQTQAKSQDADDAARYTQRAMLSTVDTVTPENAQAKLVADAVATMSKTAFNGYAASARESVLGEMAGSSRLQAEKDQFAVAVPNVYLNIHEEDTLGSDVVGKLYSNNVAKVMRDDGSDWVMVKSGSVVGYVLKDYLVEGDEAALLSDLVKKNVAMVSDDCDEDEVEVHSYKGDYGVVSTVSQG
ncbi:MAG: SH3 domain-containing protein, partial [Eubacteriales bacterium]|nr:SH3 domain-containing protein [Eubacteriales bacterium]